MKVKVKISDIIHETEKATLFLIEQKEVWLPKYWFILKNNFIILEEKIAIEKFLYYKPFIHIPDKMKIEKSEVIDELKL